jgi:thioredoxin 1
MELHVGGRWSLDCSTLVTQSEFQSLTDSLQLFRSLFSRYFFSPQKMMMTKWMILLNFLTTALAFRSFSTSTSRRKLHVLKSSSELVELKDSNYQQVFLKNKAVLVDAFAPWCGPCKLIEPILEKAATKWSERISVVKYNVEGSDNRDVKLEMVLQGVMPSSLPSLILFQDGKAIATRNGALTEEELDDFLAAELSPQEKVKSGEGGYLHLAKGLDNDDYMLSST